MRLKMVSDVVSYRVVIMFVMMIMTERRHFALPVVLNN